MSQPNQNLDAAEDELENVEVFSSPFDTVSAAGISQSDLPRQFTPDSHNHYDD